MRSQIPCLIAGLSLFFALIRVVSTFPVFSVTVDEPYHLATGLEWIERHEMKLSHQQPPFAKSVVAILPYLAGVRTAQATLHPFEEGWHIVSRAPTNTIALARFGPTIFFILGGWLLWFWVKSLSGRVDAALAVLYYATLPALLAYAGLAVLDSVLTTILIPVFWSLSCWVGNPSWRNTVLLSVFATAAVLAKYNAIPFILVSLFAVSLLRVAVERPRWPAWNQRGVAEGLLKKVLVATAISLVILWAGFAFNVKTWGEVSPEMLTRASLKYASRPAVRTALLSFLSTPLPLTQFLEGIRLIVYKSSADSGGYLLGEVIRGGRWHFFWVCLLVKNPIPFLFLAMCGSWHCFRWVRSTGDWKRAVPLVCGLAILLSVMPLKLNIGSRYILPIYPLVCILAAYGTRLLWQYRSSLRWNFGKILATVLCGWHLIESALAHPDYLAYFNQLAGQAPEQILVLSDLDWGQDVLRLRDVLAKRKIGRIKVAAIHHQHEFSLAQIRSSPEQVIEVLEPNAPTTGWVAASAEYLYFYQEWAWLREHEPVERIGKSIFLYQIVANDAVSAVVTE